MPTWTWLIPVLAMALLAGAIVTGVGPLLAVLCGVVLIGAVFAAVHHAEVVAHRVGEPFGTLVLAVAVTVIEVALILSMMLAGGADTAYLAARHALRGRDDHLQRRRGHLHTCGRARASRADLSRRRSGRGAGRADRDVGAHPRAAVLHDQHCRRHLSSVATCLRRDRVGRALGDLRLRPDRSAPRLFPSRRGRRQPRSARGAADGSRGMDELRLAPRLAGGGRGPGQDALADDRARGRGRGCAPRP